MTVDDIEKEMEREAAVRRRILRDFNKEREDFATEEEFNDYLEEVEEIIEKLVYGIDVDHVNERISTYRKENAALTRKIRARQQERQQARAAQLAEEERQRQTRRLELMRADHEERLRKKQEEDDEREQTLRQVTDNRLGQSDQTVPTQRQRSESRDLPRIRVRGSEQASMSTVIRESTQQRTSAPMQTAHVARRRTLRGREPEQPYGMERTKVARDAAGFQPELWIQRALSQLRLVDISCDSHPTRSLRQC